MNGKEKAERHSHTLCRPAITYLLPYHYSRQYFVGQSYLNMLTTSGVQVGNVTFEPGCRNNWHIHHAKSGGGQLLICTAGEGW